MKKLRTIGLLAFVALTSLPHTVFAATPAELIAAILSGNATELRALLATTPTLVYSGVDQGNWSVQSTGVTRINPLHVAAMVGNVDMIRALLEKGYSPLEYSIGVRSRHDDSSNESEVTFPDHLIIPSNRTTPKHRPIDYAIANHRLEAVELLFSSFFTETVGFDTAVEYENLVSLLFLLQHVDSDRRGAKVFECIVDATITGRLALANDLMNEYPTLALDRFPLHVSKKLQVLESGFERLISQISLHEPDFEGFTTMHQAALERKTAALIALIDRGGDANTATTHSGRTPLQIAAEQNDIESINALLARGARLNLHLRGEGNPIRLSDNMRQHLANRGAL